MTCKPKGIKCQVLPSKISVISNPEKEYYNRHFSLLKVNLLPLLLAFFGNMGDYFSGHICKEDEG